jgi:hypothetical protein
LPQNGSFTDTYITLNTIVDVLSSEIRELKLQIIADDFTLWNNQDSVIINPKNQQRLPTNNDYVLIDKKTIDNIGINLDYGSVLSVPNLSILNPESIDQRFIDLYTGINGLPLSSTSPETALLSNWLPLNVKVFDTSTSIAEFSDTGSRFEYYSASSGMRIGELTQSNSKWPAFFTWDQTFYSTFLPLNSSASILTYGNGFNDLINARITESVKFLISGGALTSDFLFSEIMNFNVLDNVTWRITQNQEDSSTIIINDGPFNGFLPGFDTLRFGYETNTGDINSSGLTEDGGYFGIGTPLTSYFLEAQQLSGITPLTPVQLLQSSDVRNARLSTLLQILDGFLNGSLASTTLPFFLSKINAEDPINFTPVAGLGSQYPTFGLPDVGMATSIGVGIQSADINNPSVEGLSNQIIESTIITAEDLGYSYDSLRYDVCALDEVYNKTAIIFADSIPPIPNILPLLTTYNNFESPLSVIGDSLLPNDYAVRTFEINFKITASNHLFMQNLQPAGSVSVSGQLRVFVWLPNETAPIQVPVVEKINTGKFKFSLSSPSEAKLYVDLVP